jgi:hypothetical protein
MREKEEKGQPQKTQIKKGRGRRNKPSRVARRARFGSGKRQRSKAPAPRGVQVNKGTGGNVMIPVPHNGW